MQLDQYLHQNLKKKYLFIPYLALNDPDWDMSLEIISSFFKLGADSVEIGLPFTDPVADGTTLQRAFERIINSGFKMSEFFLFLKKINQKFPQKPLIIMGYSNIFLQWGIPDIFYKLEKRNVRGIIISDLPFDEKKIFSFQQSKIPLINFITPTTTDERLHKICSASEGFLYLVSRKGVTGKSHHDFKSLVPLCNKIRSKTNKPILVGFGIREKKQAEKVIQMADGFIIGSLIHEIIEKNIKGKNRDQIPRKIFTRLKEILP